MAKLVRILLVDDHSLIREGLRRVLESQRDWSICGEATNGREAVELTQRERPDVVIMDITMPGLNGLEATRQIHEAFPKTEVLILTMHESEELLRESFAAGARGVVLKGDAGKDLVQAVGNLSRHQPFFNARVPAHLREEWTLTGASRPTARTGGQKLTAREAEIVQMIAEGRSTKEIAGNLGIAYRTAETHRTNLMRKLGAHSVSDLTRYAIRNRIVVP